MVLTVRVLPCSAQHHVHHAKLGCESLVSNWASSRGRTPHLEQLVLMNGHGGHRQLDVKFALGVISAHGLALTRYDHRVRRPGAQRPHSSPQRLADVLRLHKILPRHDQHGTSPFGSIV